MGHQSLLEQVPRSGLCVGGEIIPLAFFRHGQPGRPYVVCPAELGWRIHVRAADRDAIRKAYREWASRRAPRRPRLRRSGAAENAAAAPLPANHRNPRCPVPSAPIAASAPVPARDLPELLKAERRELERANALAVQLVALKARLLTAGRPAFADEYLQRLQERHARHLERCIRLRSLISDFVCGRSPELRPA